MCIMMLLLNKSVTCYNIYQVRINYITRTITTSLRNKYGERVLESGYKPAHVEINKNINWGKNDKLGSKNNEVFSLVLPPPNVTGSLHLGHALTVTIEDVLCRWHRMLGHDVLWVPGTDHAGIATQVVVEKQLMKETGLSRQNIGREKFQEQIWKWRYDKGDTITKQLKTMGPLLDWNREVFTMDQSQTCAVQEAFIQLFERGLIYQADSLVNWCCHLQSTISDIEVQNLEISGPTKLKVPGYKEAIEFGVTTDFAYKFNDMDGEIIVSTTRPETLLGDVAVAISPNDSRYADLRSKKVWHPFRQETIPIICDDYANPEVGTGAVKITPAHDRNDFEISKIHNLPLISVINEQGEMSSNCGEFSGMKRYYARDSIIKKLKLIGLHRGQRNHPMSIPICSRTGDIIEYLLKPQWFIKTETMAEKAMAEVREGRLEIEPSSFEKKWFEWLENNSRDWCISRQLWWGHQIPVYNCHCNDAPGTKTWIAARTNEEAIKKASAKLKTTESNITATQDADVLDTWFSSALFPFSVHGWPQKTDSLARYYPLTLMETGHDILFFWVARMVMLGMELTGVLPFKKILLHGIICDANGRKMSKSLGNVINPEDVIQGISLQALNEKAQKSFEAGILTKDELSKTIKGQSTMFPNGIPECGTDALRFTLCSHNIKAHFINFDVNECYTNKLFCNKIWQATRYTKILIENCRIENMFSKTVSREDLNLMDIWIMSRLSDMIDIVNDAIRKKELHNATTAIKHFFYGEFCDIYVEATKPDLRVTNEHTVVSCHTLLICLKLGLHCLSPFMPYLSHELLSALPKIKYCNVKVESLKYPTDELKSWRNLKAEKDVMFLLDVVSTIRRLRATNNLTTKEKAQVHIQVADNNDNSLISQQLNIISTLSNCGSILTINNSSFKARSLFDTVNSTCSVFLVPEKSLEEYNVNLTKKQDKLIKEIEKLSKIISNPGYKMKASAAVQDSHLKKMHSLKEELKKISQLRNKS